MHTLAWIALVMVTLDLIMVPMLWGQPREPYGIKKWLDTLITTALVAPLAMRVLGWL